MVEKLLSRGLLSHHPTPCPSFEPTKAKLWTEEILDFLRKSFL